MAENKNLTKEQLTQKYGHEPGKYKKQHKHRPLWLQTTLRVFEGPAAKIGLVMLIIILIL